MHKNWSYSNKPIAKIESFLKLIGVSENKLNFILNNKNKFFKKVPVIRNNKKRMTYKVIGELSTIHESIKKHVFSNVVLPNYITGGRKGISYIDDCRMHCDKSIIIQEDIKDFFPSITEELIKKAFQYYMNFSPEVSMLLAKISTLEGSLVQGTTLSTDIANLIFLEEEVALSHEIQNMGGVYTRYVDDITIGFKNEITNADITKVKKMVGTIIIKSGLRLNKRKSKIMRDGQTKIVHGVKVIKEIRPTQKRKRDIRMYLFNFSKKVLCNEDVMTVLSSYFKIRGLVNTLKQQGDINHAEYMKQADDLLTSIDKKSAIKSIRAMRKLKNIKKLRTLYSKLKPLGKISDNILKILDVEYKTCKRKLDNESRKLLILKNKII
ncbi:reverse transcriptase family protein [Klebsiella sp. K4-172]|uniref:reverse transcriptase family protein n=1 Tax=Klebsiella sp. K4-172 TaxID=2920185 RepID=UPI0024DE10EF|nr:reverse transcriptase family protein [Klebsiella sp. K4-172]MDK1895509.1 reverse transcriptase family protein [Klebsiella sp. K4-172]